MCAIGDVMDEREREILKRLYEEALQRLDQARAEVERLEAERYGLELALARTGTDSPSRSSGATSSMRVEPDPENEWLALDRTEAVHRVMREAGEPIHRKDILSRLWARGRTTDTLELVGATLAHLKKTGRAVGHGGGKYAIPDPNETDPAATGSVSGPLKKGEPDDDGHHRGHPTVMQSG